MHTYSHHGICTLTNLFADDIVAQAMLIRKHYFFLLCSRRMQILLMLLLMSSIFIFSAILFCGIVLLRRCPYLSSTWQRLVSILWRNRCCFSLAHFHASGSTTCCLDLSSVSNHYFWFEEGLFWMWLWRTETHIWVWDDVWHHGCISWLVFAILVEIKGFTDTVGLGVICCLRMPIIWHRHVWTLGCLNLQLVIQSWVVLILRHSSLSCSSSSCSCIPLSLVPRSWMWRHNFPVGVDVISTVSWRSRLEEEVILKFLCLIHYIFFFWPVGTKRVSCCLGAYSSWSVFNGRVGIALDTSNFVLVVPIHLLSDTSVGCISHHIRQSSLTLGLASSWVVCALIVGSLIALILCISVFSDPHGNIRSMLAHSIIVYRSSSHRRWRHWSSLCSRSLMIHSRILIIMLILCGILPIKSQVDCCNHLTFIFVLIVWTMHKSSPFVLKCSAMTWVLLRSHSLSMRCARLSWLMSHVLLLTIEFHLTLIITAVWRWIEWNLVLSCLIVETASGVLLDWFTYLKLDGCVMGSYLLAHRLSSYDATHDCSLVVNWDILWLRLYLHAAVWYNLLWLSMLRFQLILSLYSFLFNQSMTVRMQRYLRICSIMPTGVWLFYFWTMVVSSSILNIIRDNFFCILM